MLQIFFRNKNISKILKLRLRQNFDICIRNLDTNKERYKTNIFERKVYGRILGPVNDNGKENCRI
jgi:hypothetical protein